MNYPPPSLTATITQTITPIATTPIPSPTITAFISTPTTTSTSLPVSTPTPEPNWAFQIAFVVLPKEENSAGLWIYSSETQKSTLLVSTKPDFYIGPIIRLRPDKRAIGYTVDNGNGGWAIWEVDIATNQTKQLTPLFSTHDYYGFLRGWSPDQQWLYIHWRDTSVLQEEHDAVINLNSQQIVELDDLALAWSPLTPNRYVANGVGSDPLILKLKELGNNPVVFQMPKTVRASFAQWSPDEQKIAVGFRETGEFSCLIFDLEMNQWTLATTGNRTTIILEWSPDNKWIPLWDVSGSDYELAFFDSQEFKEVIIPNLQNTTPVDWVDSTSFFFKMDGNIYAANPEQPEIVIQIIELNDLYPNFDPSTNIIAWKLEQ